MYFGPVIEEPKGKEKEEKKREEKTKNSAIEKMKFGVNKDIGTIIKEFGLPKLFLILGCGIAIIVLTFFPNSLSFKSTSSKSNNNTGTNTTSTKKTENNSTTQEYTDAIENRLKQILMQVKDIGQVEVMITLKSSKELVPLKDQPSEEQTTKEQDSAGGSRESNSVSKKDETVLVESETGESEPYIVKEIEPKLEGVLIICKGGDSEYVKSEVVSAVLALFDIPANKIKVMKMN